MRTPFRRYAFFALGLVALCIICGVIVLRARRSAATPFDNLGFAATAKRPAYQEYYLTADGPVWGPIHARWFMLKSAFRSPRTTPAIQTFMPNAGTWSIHGLLNEATQVSGTRYLIDPDYAQATLSFSLNNYPTPAQWVVYTERMLATSQINLRTEHLAFLRYPADHTIIVLPQSKAPAFLQKYPTNAPVGK